jgi:small-conductance mechanosensitive channel
MNYRELLIQFSYGEFSIELLLTWIIALLAGGIFHFIVFRAFIHLSGTSKFFQTVVDKLYFPSLLLVLIVATKMVIPLMGFEMPIVRFLRHILSLLIIAFTAWMMILTVTVGRKFALRKHDVTIKDNLRARMLTTQYNMIEKILEFLIILVAIGIALMTFEEIRKIGISLLASAGIAGIILGFAAQRVIATILAGIQLAITQPIRIDDVVIVEGEWGWVEEIHLTFVVVKIWDKRRMILPTTYFIEKPFQNWTRSSASIMGTVFIHTDYNIPFDKLREELTRVLKSSELWDGEVNVLQVTDAKEKSVEIRALMSSFDSPSAWDLRVLVREKLIEYLQKNYPGSLPRSRVELTKEGK